MSELLPVLFVGAFVALSLVVRWWRTQRALRSWRESALGLGLNLRGTENFEDPVMYGNVDGISVHATLEWRGSGKSRTRYTVVKADVGCALPRGFKLSAERLGSGLLKMLGEQDIQLGDPRLDDALLVQGDRPGEVRALLLRAPVRQAVLRCFEYASGTVITDGQVCVTVRGISADDIARLIRDAVGAARALAEEIEGFGDAGSADGGFRGRGSVSSLPAMHPHVSAGRGGGATAPAGLVQVQVQVPGAGPNAVASLARVIAGPGVTVAEGDLLCEVFTAKGTVGVCSPCAGVVESVHARLGDSLRAGAPLVKVWPTLGESPSASGLAGLSSVPQALTLSGPGAPPVVSSRDPDPVSSVPLGRDEQPVAQGGESSEAKGSGVVVGAPPSSLALSSMTAPRPSVGGPEAPPVLPPPDGADPGSEARGLEVPPPLLGGADRGHLSPLEPLEPLPGPEPDPDPDPEPDPAPLLDQEPVELRPRLGSPPPPSAVAPAAPVRAPPRPAGAPGLPPAVLATLDTLATGRVPLSKRDDVVGAHADLLLHFTFRVEDVRWSSGLFLPDALRKGRTATGTVVGSGHSLAVRFPATRNGELDAARGASVTVVGRLAEWDDLYRRALVDDDG